MALLDILKKKKDKKSKPVEKTADAHTPQKEKMFSKKEEKKVASKTKLETDEKKKGERFAHIILQPRITEKASTQSGGNSYTFIVAREANKILIKKAIQEIYNVKPIKVNIINVKPKQKMVRNIWGRTSAFKKAVVFLKDGDTIEFV